MTCKDGHANPKTSIVMHHAVSDLMTNWSDAKVAKWFSDVGRNRGYAGVAHSYHCDPTGAYESFAQAQYCLHPYTLDKNKYGWRLTELIKYPFENACWHASNWAINQSSIGIETAGNYVNQPLDEKALMLIADTFRPWDVQIGGQLVVYPHKKFAATACPGKIADQIPTLYDMFNNPAKWNAKLFPKPPVATCEERLETCRTNWAKKVEKEKAACAVQINEMIAAHDKEIEEIDDEHMRQMEELSQQLDMCKTALKNSNEALTVCNKKLEKCDDPAPPGCLGFFTGLLGNSPDQPDKV